MCTLQIANLEGWDEAQGSGGSTVEWRRLDAWHMFSCGLVASIRIEVFTVVPRRERVAERLPASGGKLEGDSLL